MRQTGSQVIRVRIMKKCPAVLVIIAFALGYLILAPSPARAPVGIPDPGNSIVPEVVTGCAPWIIVVRDTENNPMEGALVSLHFGPALPLGTGLGVWDLEIPPATQDCETHTIMAETDRMGIAAFVPLFGGYVNEAKVEIYADGIFFGYAKARSTDINGDGWCGVLDLNYFRHYYYNDPLAEEADFNWSGSVELGDLSIFRYSFFLNRNALICP
jgi:hypothetical protein